MQFWNGWELWEKMCFVLGVLIAIVLIYSFGVLAYNRRKLKKYAAIEAYQKAEQQRNLDLEEIRNDIPFGARALESGIQIEGIWISKNNTPLPSPRQPGTPLGSRPPSPTPRQTSQPPTAAVTAQAEKQPVACSTLPQLNDSRPSRYASRASSVIVVDDRYGSESLALEKQHSRRRTHSETDRPARTAPLRGSISQSQRYSEPSAETLGLLEGYRQKPRAENPRGRPSSSDEFGTVVNRIISEHMPERPHETIQLRQNFASRPFKEDRRNDLDAMYNHRRSHVAETGQLGSARSSGSHFKGDKRAHSQELVDKLNAVAAKQQR